MGNLRGTCPSPFLPLVFIFFRRHSDQSVTTKKGATPGSFVFFFGSMEAKFGKKNGKKWSWLRPASFSPSPFLCWRPCPSSTRCRMSSGGLTGKKRGREHCKMSCELTTLIHYLLFVCYLLVTLTVYSEEWQQLLCYFA